MVNYNLQVERVRVCGSEISWFKYSNLLNREDIFDVRIKIYLTAVGAEGRKVRRREVTVFTGKDR